MGGLRANSDADATVIAEELFMKPAPAVNQGEEAHPTLSPQPIFDRVLPSLGGDILEQAKEVVEQQQDDDDDQIVIDDDSAQSGPLEALPEADKDGGDNGIVDTENGGPEDSKMTKTPPKYGTIQGGIDGPPYLPKDIEELGGDDVALAPKQMRDPVVVPAVRSKEEDVEIGQEDEIEFEFDGNSEENKDEAEVEETTMNDDDDDDDDNVREESADDVVEIVASEIEAEESGDGDDDTADDDRTDRDDDNIDDDDAVDDADGDKPVVESVSLKKRKPDDETKEPSDDSDTALCGKKSSISALLCKTSALIRYHTVGIMFGASLILAFYCYRRKRRLGGRRSRRLDKSHEYARIIQEYDDLGTFDDDISYNDDNETMSTWSGGGVGGLEMQNYHSDDRLGVHELNG